MNRNAIFILFIIMSLTPDSSSITISDKQITVTHHDYDKSWNEAQAICVANGGSLYTEDSTERRIVLAKFRASWSFLDVWIGLHYPATESDDEYGWTDCFGQDINAYSHWMNAEPKKSSIKRCALSDKTSGDWRTDSCQTVHRFVCQTEGGACNFTTGSGTPIFSLDYDVVTTTVATVEACKSRCLTTTLNFKNCWALSYAVISECVLYYTDNPFLFSALEISTDSTAFHVKECYISSNDTADDTIITQTSVAEPQSGCTIFNNRTTPAPTTTSTTTPAITTTSTTTPATTTTSTTTPATTTTSTTTPAPTTTSTTTPATTTTSTATPATTTTSTTTPATTTTSTTTPAITTTSTTTPAPTATSTTTPAPTTTSTTTPAPTTTSTTTPAPTTTSTTTPAPTTISTSIAAPTTTLTTASSPITTPGPTSSSPTSSTNTPALATTPASTTISTTTQAVPSTSALSSSTSTTTVATSSTTMQASNTTSATSTTLSTTTAQTQCFCPCSSGLSATANLTTVEKVALIQSKLKVDSKSLSSSIRKKTSAKDERMASQSVGYIAIAFSCVQLGFIVIPDILKVVYYCFNRWKSSSAVTP